MIRLNIYLWCFVSAMDILISVKFDRRFLKTIIKGFLIKPILRLILMSLNYFIGAS